MNKRLIYIMDPMCSWCWGFAPVAAVLAAKAQQAGVGFDVVLGGLRSEQQPVDAAARAHYHGYWRSVQAATGQVFDFERGLPVGMCYDTEPASRAIATVRQWQPARALAMAEAVQAAFYTQGQDTTDAAVLQALAQEQGMAAADFAAAFASDALRAVVQADAAWARSVGVSGFPSVLAEQEGRLHGVSNGCQSLERIKAVLQGFFSL